MNRELYLGREVETSEPLVLSPDDFVTHAAILGMTGSGKTGLALGLVEEMVEAGIPVIAIDPKGDLPNLGLLFADFAPTQFQEWIDASEAKRENLTVAELAVKKAQLWKTGLAQWGIQGEQIRALQHKLDLRIFTPGSKAVNPVDLLGSFAPPSDELGPDDRADLASGIVTGLLSLLIDNVDPLRDSRHLLLVQILSCAWEQKLSLSLEELIAQILDPPFAKVGVFPVDRFYSPEDRMKLAMQFNNLLASPTFSAWKQGARLDIAALMESSAGKTPVNIFSIAHLPEKERHFFVGRLLDEVLTWTRSLTGTSSLRALIYFDEVAGYLPSHPYNPPSKKPLLTMLKQSRAVGVGLCLATQNPVDLDYKALSNMGIWMIGRLQTEQDRKRVRDGLISASGGLTAQEVDAEFSKIKPRVFLLKKSKVDKPIVFETRWVMSYLRGPITLAELPRIAAPLAQPQAELDPDATIAKSESPNIEARRTPPPIPSGFGQSFLDPRCVFEERFEGHFQRYQEPIRSDEMVLNKPALRAVIQLKFQERKDDFLCYQKHHFVAFPIDESHFITSKFQSLWFEDEDFLYSPPDNAVFGELPEAFDQAEEFKQVQSELVDHLYRNFTTIRFTNEAVKLYAKAGEERDDFLARCIDVADTLIEEDTGKLRKQMETKIDRVRKRLDRAKDKVEHLLLKEKGQKLEGMWRAGEAVMSLFSKKRKSLSSAFNSSRRAMEADVRTRQAKEDMQKLEIELAELERELAVQTRELEDKHTQNAEKIEEKEIRLYKKDIEVERFEVLWIPVGQAR